MTELDKKLAKAARECSADAVRRTFESRGRTAPGSPRLRRGLRGTMPLISTETARSMGFRTYLYFVATDDAAINADRVARRHAQGGHAVPAEKIVQRYGRSIANVSRQFSRAARPSRPDRN